jgi:excisionase family DNA binding protein
MLHTGIAALAAHGRAVDLRLVPPSRDAVTGTPASTAVPTAPNLIHGSREEPQEYLTVAEVAVMLRVSRATIYRLVHAGRLPGMRVGRSIRVSPTAVQRYLRDAALGGPQT